MTISRAIIDDLYPLYAAGEASADSGALIEEYLRENPTAATALKTPPRLPSIEPPPDLEARALKRTARLLEERSLAAAAALSLSYAPTAVVFFERGKLQVLFQNLPWLAGLLYAAAIGCWIRFIRVCVQVQATGLRPRRTWTARFVWLFSGVVVGSAIAFPVQFWTGWQRAVFDLPGIIGVTALGIGERLGQIATPGQITRPITILGPESDREDD